jgi:flagellar biosynthesis protein FlhA
LAAATGATVVDRSSVVVTHLAEVVRGHAAELLSRQQVQLLLEGLRTDEPLLAGEVGTEALPMGLLHAVLRGLLEERVAVRDLARIIEAVSARCRETRSVELLVAAARVAVGSAIATRIAPDRELAVLTLDPQLEGSLLEGLRDVDGTLHLVVDPAHMSALLEGIRQAVAAAQALPEGGRPIALLCGQMLRRPVQRALNGAGIDVPVLAYPELPGYFVLAPIGVVGNAHIDA